MQLCSRREYCRKEIFEKALSWGCSPAKANELVNELVKQNYIDERRYTEAYTKDKLRFNKWGRIKISYMLRSQKIDSSIIAAVLSEIDETEYNKTLFDELQKKYRGLKGSLPEIKLKLFRFASSRGFEPDIVHNSIFQLLRK